MAYRINKDNYLELKKLERAIYGGQQPSQPSPGPKPNMNPPVRPRQNRLATTRQTQEQIQEQTIQKIQADADAELAAIESAKNTELKNKYGSTKQYYVMNESKNAIITFMDQLKCCQIELNIGYDSNIHPDKKAFLEILKKNYDKMVNIIVSKNQNTQEIASITNYVSPEDIQQYFSKHYEKNITNIFDAYEMFLKRFTEEIKNKKIPFYVVLPIGRRNNPLMKSDNVPAICNPTKSVPEITKIPDCHLLLSAQYLVRIRLPLKELYDVTANNAYPPELHIYLFNLLQRIDRQIDICNYIVKEQKLHNYEITASCMYNKGKFGDRQIYDNRICESNKKVKSQKDCDIGCEYDKKTSTCKTVQ